MSNINETSPEKSAFGYKGLIAALLIASVFIGFFYLAVTSEPDYMPSQQMKRQQEAQQQAQQQNKATEAEATATATTEPKKEATATAEPNKPTP